MMRQPRIEVFWAAAAVFVAAILWGISTVFESPPVWIGWASLALGSFGIIALFFFYFAPHLLFKKRKLEIFTKLLTSSYANRYISLPQAHSDSFSLYQIAVKNTSNSVMKDVKVVMTYNTVGTGEHNPSSLVCVVDNQMVYSMNIGAQKTGFFDFIYDLPDFSSVTFAGNFTPDGELCGICTKKDTTISSGVEDFVRFELSIEEEGVCLEKAMFKASKDACDKVALEKLNWY